MFSAINAKKRLSAAGHALAGPLCQAHESEVYTASVQQTQGGQISEPPGSNQRG